MRIGLPFSIVLHLAILIWATISLGSARLPLVPDEIPVEVSLLTTADLAKMRKGALESKTKTTSAKLKDAPADAPVVKAKRIAEAPPPPEEDPVPPEPKDLPKDPPKRPEPVKVPDPPKPEPPKPDPIAQQLAKADPLPEPKKPEPVKEPVKPEPPKPDPIADQLAKPEPPPDPAVEAAKKAAEEEARKKAAEAEAKKAKELAKKAAEDKKRKDDEAKAKKLAAAERKKQKLASAMDKLQAQISQLPDAAPDAGSDVAPDPTANSQAPAVGVKRATGTQLSATESQMLLGIFGSKVKGCWTVLAGAADGRELVVPVSFDLGPDGRLLSEPVVTGGGGSPSFALAAENVVHAIRQCEPYALPPGQYDKWRHWDINFDPRAMFGG